MILDGSVRLTHLWEHAKLSETVKRPSMLKHLIFYEYEQAWSLIVLYARNLFLIKY